VKKFLRGRAFRYPLHPLLVHFPIGFFVLSFLLDLASWAVPLQILTGGAFYAMAAGVGTALLAAVPGLVDYQGIRRDHPARRTASIHAILNLLAVGLYAVNLGLRYPDLNAAQSPVLPFTLSVAGVLLLSVSGYLGGVLVYDDGIGVGRHRRTSDTPRHTLSAGQAAHPGDLVPVAGENALKDTETLRVEVAGQVICIAKSEGRLYAFQEFCTHRYGPLSEGVICQNQVQCPWHRSVFDMATGKVIQGPAKTELKIFHVEVREGQIWVSPPSAAQQEPRDVAA
jgi:uncharacterized membrane protein/nitrite reductase/ring-hydroxylating ferredoxin subunit